VAEVQQQLHLITKNKKGNTMRINIITCGGFSLGQVVSTPGAQDACSPAYLIECLSRHARGDWGVVCAEDAATNDEALKLGNRVLSAYPIDPAKPSKGYGENTLWIITESDRSVTTFLLPSEY
jgi:hypothetical protein